MTGQQTAPPFPTSFLSTFIFKKKGDIMLWNRSRKVFASERFLTDWFNFDELYIKIMSEVNLA